MVIHLVRTGALIILLALCMIYPYLPGSYDPMALIFSAMAQVSGIAGLPLVLVGILWLLLQLWKRRPGFVFALLALVIDVLVALMISAASLASGSLAFGLLTLALVAYVVFRFHPGRRLLNSGAGVPLYLIVLPLVVLVLQIMLAAPLTEASRNRAIANSAELIREIEAYRAANGQYPVSLLGVWQDYPTGVIGMRQYHYTPQGDAYNLVFEQPRFLLDNIGAREFVVYNPLDEQMMISHDSWILDLSPVELSDNQGWFETGEVGIPHWKYFLFD